MPLSEVNLIRNETGKYRSDSADEIQAARVRKTEEGVSEKGSKNFEGAWKGERSRKISFLLLSTTSLIHRIRIAGWILDELYSTSARSNYWIDRLDCNNIIYFGNVSIRLFHKQCRLFYQRLTRQSEYYLKKEFKKFKTY